MRDTVLTTTDLDEMTDQLIPRCMVMLDALPNTVFKICQLIVVAAKRNGDEWRGEMFKQLFLQVRLLLYFYIIFYVFFYVCWIVGNLTEFYFIYYLKGPS